MSYKKQRSFENKKGELIEVGEYNLNFDKKEKTNLQELLVEFIIEKLYFAP